MTPESERFLSQVGLLLRITDVSGDDRGKGEIRVAFCDLSSVLVGTVGDLTANGVFGFKNVGVDGFGGQHGFVSGGLGRG